MDAEDKPAGQPEVSRLQPGEAPTSGVPGSLAARPRPVTSKRKAQRLLGAIAALAGGYGGCVNFARLKHALHRASQADSALSAALMALSLLIAVAGLLILLASFSAGKKRGSAGKERRA